MSEGKRISKRHHYVPKAYLKGFANHGEFIHVTPKDPSVSGFPVSIDRIALKKHYNTMEDPPIFERADEAERQLGALDSKAAKILRKIEQKEWRLTFEEREDLARFISIQAHRGPEIRESHERFLDAMVERSSEMDTPQKLLQFVDEYEGANYPLFDAEAVWKNLQDPDFDFKEDLRLQHLQNTFYSAEAEVPFLVSRKWTFFYFAKKSLVCSDAPLSMFAPTEPISKSSTTLRGAGALLFPLSRRVALHLGKPYGISIDAAAAEQHRQIEMLKRVLDGKLDEETMGTTKLSNQFNLMTVLFAQKNIFRHPDDSDLDLFIHGVARGSEPL